MRWNTAAVLDQPGWHPLASFVARFYRDPLEVTDTAAASVAAAEERLGRPLPTALREWFLLACERFANVNQDHAVRIEQLKVTRERLAVWWENQGNWSFEVLLDSRDDDPWTVVEVSDIPEWNRRDRLSRCLFGMTLSDTLVGGWHRGGTGPLGPLRSSVVGGIVRPPLSPEIARRVAALAPIDATTNPHFPDPCRGDASLIVRDGGGHFEYIAADEEAFERAQALFDLREREREEPWTLVVELPSKPDYDRFRQLRHPDGSPAGRYAAGWLTHRGGELEFETRDPEAALAAVRVLLDERELDGMRAAAHPRSAVRFRPLWPPGAPSFVRFPLPT